MSVAATTVERMWERMQAQDWEGVEDCLAPDLAIRWPHTGERFTTRSAYLAANRNYPDGWSLALQRVIDDGVNVATLVELEHDGQVFHCAGFYELADGRVARGVEYWVTAGAALPPEWRRAGA
jgi:ketosteroid isomerase-like protein